MGGTQTNLSVLRPWFGREADLAAVLELLSTGRVVVVTGPPGIGKSRLAAEVARTWRGEVAWCSLEGIGPADVAVRVATALGIGSDSAIGHALRGRPVILLVLDEAEEAACTELADLIEGWRGDAVDLRCLVASRVRLDARADRWNLEPLDIASARLGGGPGARPGDGLDVEEAIRQLLGSAR